MPYQGPDQPQQLLTFRGQGVSTKEGAHIDAGRLAARRGIWFVPDKYLS